MEQLRALRDTLLEHRDDYDAARAAFEWPQLGEFNWALDWFDPMARGNEQTGLLVVEQDGSARQLSFDALARRSDQLANWLRAQGVARGDRILLMLGNQIELWETMLAAMKLGAVIIPATTLLAEADLRDRIERGNARHVVVRSADAGKFDGVPGDYTRIAVGDAVDGWLPYADAYQAPEAFAPDGATRRDRHAAPVLHVRHDRAAEARRAHARLLSGRPPLARCTGSGSQPGDVHLNLSSPGWAKHAWSNFFAPWLAEATVAIFNYERFDATRTARRDRHARRSRRSARRRRCGGC